MGSVIELPVSTNIPLINWSDTAISSLTAQQQTVRNTMVSNGSLNSSFVYLNRDNYQYRMSNVAGFMMAYYVENGVYGAIMYVPANAIFYTLNDNSVNCNFGYARFNEGYREGTEDPSVQMTYYNYFTSYQEAYDAIHNEKPIIYRDTNCSHIGPDNAAVGDTVTVNYTFPDGYGIVNPSTNIYVTNNGIVVPSSYANGTLTFTMPDPSQ